MSAPFDCPFAALVSVTIDARLLEAQAQLISTRRDAIARMQQTMDEWELWALRQVVRELEDAIREMSPIDHWWWWHFAQTKRCGACRALPSRG